jgi:transposase
MMGERIVMQEALFYGFSLERHIPSDHMLRKIDRFVDLSGVRAHLEPFYSNVGRPSIDPELMIRMLLVGYCYGIRSERRLCDEVHLNLAYRWFCRLGLDGDVPDHSTFSKNRHGRFRDSDLLRQVFETVVARCMTEGLVGGEAFAVDASMVVADAHRQRGVASSDELAPTSNRAVTEYLAVVDDAASAPRNVLRLMDHGLRHRLRMVSDPDPSGQPCVRMICAGCDNLASPTSRVTV